MPVPLLEPEDPCLPPGRTLSSRMEAPRTGCALAGAPPSHTDRDPASQCRLSLPTEGITFHPVHYLTRRPFAHWFHYQSHGRRGWCRVGRGARTESKVRSPRRPQVGSVARRSVPGWVARRGRLLCMGPEAGASEPAAVGTATAGEKRWGRLSPSPVGGHSCSLRCSAPGVRPERLQFMVRAAEGRSREGKRYRRTAAANLPASSPGAREWSPRHDEPPGGNDEGPPATQNISPQPSGAGRALHEPPARSPPHGPAPRADSRCARGVCACVCQRAPGARGLSHRRPGMGHSRSSPPAPGAALDQTRAGKACATEAPKVVETAVRLSWSLEPGVG